MLIPTLLALPILGVAAVHDYRERHVSNLVSGALIFFGAGVMSARVVAAFLGGGGAPVAATYLLHMSLGSLLALLPWLLGGYGGADAKVVLGLALVTGNVWAVLAVVAVACVLAGVYYFFKAVDGRERRGAPFVPFLCCGVVSLLPALL